MAGDRPTTSGTRDPLRRNVILVAFGFVVAIGALVALGLSRAGPLTPSASSWAIYAAVAAGLVGSLAFFVRSLLLQIRRHEATEKMLQEQQRRLRTILDRTVDGLITIDEAGRIDSVSKAAEAIFGYSEAELVGRNVSILMPQPHRGEHDGYLRRYLATGEARIIGSVREVKGQRSNGEVFPLELSVAEIDLGGRRGFLGSLRDVTQRKASEATLRQAQKMESVGQLTGGIAHDFNNLLTVILGNAEAIVERTRPGQPVHALAEMVQRAADRGAELTHRLLAFARRQPLEPVELDVNELVRGMHTLLRRALGESVEVAMTLAEDLWAVSADPGQLENALLNLAINARDAMPEGGRFVIETSNIVFDGDDVAGTPDASAGEHVVIAVSDTGSGMPREVLDRAVEPFFTTKEVGRGSGLGLSMIYGYVKQTGGHMKIYSEVGHGTTVRLYLPRHRPQGQARAARDPAEEAVPTGTETILLVEDDPLVRKSAVQQVGALGYRVIAADSGPAALAMVEQGTAFDLLLTDIVMPGGMNGRQLAEEVARRRPGVPVLYVSGYSDSIVMGAKGIAPGVRLLAKPYRRRDLARKIREALDAKG